MFKIKTVLSQLQSFIFEYDFKNITSEYQGDKGVKTFATRNLMGFMMYVHMVLKQSLRNIVEKSFCCLIGKLQSGRRFMKDKRFIFTYK